MCYLRSAKSRKRIGVSIRTLHHYDEIGLLSPKHRSNSGYRLYSVEDLMQLQKIKSLQQLDFSLEKIRILMNQPEASLLSVLNKHIQKLLYKLEQQRVPYDRLQQLAKQLANNGKQFPSVNLLFDSLRVTIMYEKYYTADQLKQLEERRKLLGEETLQTAQREWQEIFEKFKKLYQDGKSSICSRGAAISKTVSLN